MKLGAERKKLAILGGLLAIAAVVYFFNSSGGGESSSTSTPAARNTSTVPAVSPGAPQRDNTQSARPARARATQEFRPSLKPKRGEERPDPLTIDPTLRLDLLAKLQTVGMEGTHRSLFDFSQAPPPKVELAKIAGAKPPKVPSPFVPPVTPAATPATNGAGGKPPAPPIPMKFFGYMNAAGRGPKRAFFVEGDEIHVVTEGDTVKKRYKIVRIGVNSVVVEDTQFGSQQTLPLEEQPS